jgi:4'-phosphopantetheinyl transferase
MPLVFEKILDPGTRLGVWLATEGDDFFQKGIHLHEIEKAEIAKLQTRKKSEWLASRYLLHYLTGRDERLITLKDESGKPYLEGNAHHISLSHSGNYTAAIIADHSTGIDIQMLQPKIERIVPKFLSAFEIEQLPHNDVMKFWHIYWGAKECLFKAYGKGRVDFKTQLFIHAISEKDEFCLGEVRKADVTAQYRLEFLGLQDSVLVYIAKEIFKIENDER